MNRSAVGDTIYLLLHTLEPRQRRTAMAYVDLRMAEDQRADEAKKNPGTKPTFWCLNSCDPAGEFAGPSLSDLLAEFDGRDFQVTEATGMAVVEQRFLVWVPIDGGWEPESFATRAEAEACAAQWKAEAAKPATPVRPEGMEPDEYAVFMAWWRLVAAQGGYVDEGIADRLDSATWVLRFRAGMTPDLAFRDSDIIPI